MQLIGRVSAVFHAQAVNPGNGCRRDKSRAICRHIQQAALVASRVNLVAFDSPVPERNYNGLHLRLTVVAIAEKLAGLARGTAFRSLCKAG